MENTRHVFDGGELIENDDDVAALCLDGHCGTGPSVDDAFNALRGGSSA
jgi:hypothetical protein